MIHAIAPDAKISLTSILETSHGWLVYYNGTEFHTTATTEEQAWFVADLIAKDAVTPEIALVWGIQ